MRKIEFRARKDKLALIGQQWHKQMQGAVLDVGCDQCYIKRFTRGNYVGIDISGSPDVVADLDFDIPFPDSSFDMVIALDILEHLDDMHHAFNELCRVSRKYIIIGLPNMYEWRFRLSFLIGKALSGKYGLKTEKQEDRHRWLFSLNEAELFIKGLAYNNNYFIKDYLYGFYKYRRILPRMITHVGMRIFPLGKNLFCYYYCALLERRR